MVTFPNAKINLGLNIIEKRPDNFHNLETVFYPVPWSDALEIIPSDKLEFNASGIAIDGDPENNLCIRVFKAMKAKFGLPPVKIHLHKAIPVGAGLGGGSSDAAFAAKLINDVFNLSLTEQQLEELVKPSGSDCAFFIRNKPVYAYGKGDQFEPITLSLKGKFICMIYPDLAVSTREAYDGVQPGKPSVNIRDIITKDISEWKSILVNDFEHTLFRKYPILSHIKEKLYAEGALYASMSGSGSTLFGIFESSVEIEKMFLPNYKIHAGYLN